MGYLIQDQDQYQIQVEGLDNAKRLATWGTFGKNHTERLRFVRLIDCSTEHLLAILATQPQVNKGDYGTIIRAILKDRGVPAFSHTVILGETDKHLL